MMRIAALVALALALPTVANGALLRGQLEGPAPQLPWTSIGGPGKTYLLDFTIDTATTTAIVHVFIDGNDVLNGEGTNPFNTQIIRAPGDTGRGGIGAITEDSFVKQFLFMPDTAFGMAFAIPGAINESTPGAPLTGLTFSDITGITFGFNDMDEISPVPFLYAVNARPVQVPVPEPSTFVLGLFAVAGLWVCRKLVGASKVPRNA